MNICEISGRDDPVPGEGEDGEHDEAGDDLHHHHGGLMVQGQQGDGRQVLPGNIIKLDLAINNVKPKDWYFVLD